MPSAVKAHSPYHWTAREFPTATLGNSIQQCFTKLNIYFPYASAIPLLGIYPKETNICSHKDLNIFIIVKLEI